MHGQAWLTRQARTCYERSNKPTCHPSVISIGRLVANGRPEGVGMIIATGRGGPHLLPGLGATVAPLGETAACAVIPEGGRWKRARISEPGSFWRTSGF